MISTPVDVRGSIVHYIEGFSAVLQSVPTDDVRAVIDEMQAAFERGSRIFIAGNGGSAATASHLACDLAKTVLGSDHRSQPRRFRVTSLTDNVPLLTAWGNDVGYDHVFAEQLRNLGDSGDLLIVITCSGNSANILEVVSAAKSLGMSSIGLLGCAGGRVGPMLDHSVVVPCDDFGFIEDAHMLLTHVITAHFKSMLSDGVGSET